MALVPGQCGNQLLPGAWHFGILILRGSQSQEGEGWFSALLIHIIQHVPINACLVPGIMQGVGEQW